MVQAKQAAKRKRRKVALPVMGVAGVSLALAGGASAISKARAADMLSRDTAPPREITFDEEEIADVSLATFYVFDKEVDGILQDNTILARACGGCRGGGGGRCAAGRCGGGGRCAVARCGGGGRCAVARCGGARCAVARCAVARCGVGCGVGVTGCGGCSCSCCLSWGSCRVDC
jgi:hypothetical protein